MCIVSSTTCLTLAYTHRTQDVKLRKDKLCLLFSAATLDTRMDSALLAWCPECLGPSGLWGKVLFGSHLLTHYTTLCFSCMLQARFWVDVRFFSLRMFYGPTVGGLITQHLNFEWAAAVQGSLAFLGVSICLVHKMIYGKCVLCRYKTKESQNTKELLPCSVFRPFPLPCVTLFNARRSKGNNWPQTLPLTPYTSTVLICG